MSSSGQSERPSAAISCILPGIPLTTASSLRASVASANSTNNVNKDGPLSGYPLPHGVPGESSASVTFGRTKEQSSLTTPHKDKSPSLKGTRCSHASDTRNDMVDNKKSFYKPLRPLGSFVDELLTVQRSSKCNTPLLP